MDNAFVLQGFTSNPRFDSNRYGATFGGPIIKNKLFFFTNFERQGISLTATAGGQVLTPTADGLAAIAVDPNLSTTNFGVFKQYVPVAAAQAPSTDPTTPCQVGVNAIAYTGAPAVGACTGGAIPIGVVSIANPAFQKCAPCILADLAELVRTSRAFGIAASHSAGLRENFGTMT